MLSKKQNELSIKIRNYLTDRLDKIELILALVFLTAMILRAYTNMTFDALIALSLSSLAILYFYKSNSISGLKILAVFHLFVYKLTSLGSAVGVIGILFQINQWPNSNALVLSSSVILSGGLIMILYIKFQQLDTKMFPFRLILRVVLIIALGLFLNFNAKDDVEIKGPYKIEVIRVK